MSDAARCWGSNTYGELGRPDGIGWNAPLPGAVLNLDRAVQLSLWGISSCALREDRTAWCWGSG